jgi:type IX secretion system PorP/SprF family membrane protein
MYRDQWVNVPGAPSLTVATAQTGFKDRNLGIGLMLVNDKIGIHNNNSVYASYAYSIEMVNKGKLSMGIQAGFDNIKSDYNKLFIRDQGDPNLEGVRSDFMPNFGAGLFYHDELNYIGFSVPYLLSRQNVQDESFFQTYELPRYYYLTAGRLFKPNHRLVIKPSVLVRIQDENPLAFDANINFYIDEIIGLGASYRFNDSVIGIFEFQLNNYIKFSYAYDWILSELTPFTKGTHELQLNYRINFSAPRKHRMCPGPAYF